MRNATRVWFSLLFVAGLAACGSSDDTTPPSGADTGVEDTSGGDATTDADATDDATPDVAPDIEEDVAPDVEEDVAPDAD